jgi:hypothetical protein
MKKIIILGLILVSLGGCFIPYYEDGGGHHRHGRDRGERYEHRR